MNNVERMILSKDSSKLLVLDTDRRLSNFALNDEGVYSMKEILIDKEVLTSIHTINFLNSDENYVITVSNDFIFLISLQNSEIADHI